MSACYLQCHLQMAIEMAIPKMSHYSSDLLHPVLKNFIITNFDDQLSRLQKLKQREVEMAISNSHAFQMNRVMDVHQSLCSRRYSPGT